MCKYWHIRGNSKSPKRRNAAANGARENWTSPWPNRKISEWQCCEGCENNNPWETDWWIGQCSHMDYVLVFGFKLNHISYSRTVAQSNSVEINEDCSIAEINSREEQLVTFMTSKSLEISKNVSKKINFNLSYS